MIERLFLCNEKIKLLESKWHPGSLNDQHVVILTNDNYLRFINIFDSGLPIEEIKLPLSNSDNSSSFVDRSFSMFASSLGETAVSFDFGAPTCKFSIANRGGDELDDENSNNDVIKKVSINNVYWPIYILKGNGDVLLIYSNLLNTYISKKIYGPLKMLPYAEDNYGVDGCSLIVINSNPSLIVIATSTGLLHHCIALEEDSDNSTSFLPTIILHVFETIELTLSLTSSKQIDNNYHIMLLNNQAKNDRYFCMHLAGVHVINVPFIQQLMLDHEFELEETIVEHLICTKPIATSSEDENFIPSGLSLKFHKGFLLSILLSSGELISQKLSTVSFIKKESSSINKTIGDKEEDDLKIKPIDFHDRIKRLLQRESSTPLIKSKQATSKFEFKDGLQFILNTTETLKKEYLGKFDSVAELIDKRINNLHKEKEVQRNDLNSLKQETAMLQDQLTKLSSKYDQTLIKQEELSTKIEKIVDKLMRKQTSLSGAEVKLTKTVHNYQEKIEEYKSTMNQIKLKYTYQKEANCSAKIDKIEQQATNKQATGKDITSIQKVLKQQSADISFLVNKINLIQQHCSLKNV